eukprot:Phypoly_transcript_03155.p1 GENE.Phypoly_transcript_03155~~Phypoly_transcript_03155.p1  ORF type:complete len:741 (+),score=65.08 Phypoly_transcript_03155:181-2403(+)
MAKDHEPTQSEKIGKETKSRKNHPKDFPANVSHNDILRSLPKEVFMQSSGAAYGSLLLTLSYLFFTVFLLAVAPWFVWPFAWVVCSASMVGVLVVAHDCALHIFADSLLANDIVGTILMLPLGYSYESWKLYLRSKNQIPTNNLNARVWSLAQGPFFWLTSFGFWAKHLTILHKLEDNRTRTNNAIVSVVWLSLLSAIYYYTGFGGVLRFYGMPWLGFHVLLSITTLLPVVILDGDSANDAVHLVYPEWLEYVMNDINFMVPRRVFPTILHYRARFAYQALKQHWGEYFIERKVDWELISRLLQCLIKLEDFLPLSHPPLQLKTEPAGDCGIDQIVCPRLGLREWLRNAKDVFLSMNHMHLFWTIASHSIALYALLYVTPATNTKILGCVQYFFIQFGITAGYHRLFSHKSFAAKAPTKFFLLILGAATLQRSAVWWVRDHRAHHKYLDTDKDPYNAKQGFWYSHVGWLFFKSEPAQSTFLPIPMDDIYNDPLVMWQYNYYLPIAVSVSFVFPIFVCWLWGDFWGGVFSCFVRVVFGYQVTWMVNSFAHYTGDTPFCDDNTSRDNIFVGLLTNGEGIHNFHHAFPIDYRASPKYYQYDPAKWFIAAFSYIGQTYDLKRAPERLIRLCEFQMAQKEVEKVENKFDWQAPSEDLPSISRARFDKMSSEGLKLIIIKGLIHDVSDFFMEHPGGTHIIEQFCGSDATHAFSGGVYRHSNAAQNALQEFRIGVCAIDDDWYVQSR